MILLTSFIRSAKVRISALPRGRPLTQFRNLSDFQTRLLEAAHPIMANNEVMGAVVVDQNLNGLRTFRNEALEQH